MEAVVDSAAPFPRSDEPLPPLLANQLLAWRRRLLSESAGGSSQAAALDWLLELAGGLSWRQLQELRLDPQRPVALDRPLAELESLWQRHCHQHEPLQYLVGLCPWRDLQLAVAPGVLIPRPETELLVDLALALTPAVAPGQPLRWVDLGTGSGCLALALLHALPHSEGLAVDSSHAALLQASTNLGARLPDTAAPPADTIPGHAPPAEPGSPQRRGQLQIRQGDWWEPIRDHWGQLQLAVSNPPYIPTAELARLDAVVRDHEPWQALDGGRDGLMAIRRIIGGAPGALAPGGVLLLEHHHDQSEAVIDLLIAAGLEDPCAHHDLEGVNRFASARRAIRS
jgi:release factor glutamine methyltransferase